MDHNHDGASTCELGIDGSFLNARLQKRRLELIQNDREEQGGHRSLLKHGDLIMRAAVLVHGPVPHGHSRLILKYGFVGQT